MKILVVGRQETTFLLDQDHCEIQYDFCEYDNRDTNFSLNMFIQNNKYNHINLLTLYTFVLLNMLIYNFMTVSEDGPRPDIILQKTPNIFANSTNR